MASLSASAAGQGPSESGAQPSRAKRSRHILCKVSQHNDDTVRVLEQYAKVTPMLRYGIATEEGSADGPVHLHTHICLQFHNVVNPNTVRKQLNGHRGQSDESLQSPEFYTSSTKNFEHAVGYACKGSGADERFDNAREEKEKRDELAAQGKSYNNSDYPGYSVFAKEPATDVRILWSYGECKESKQGERTDLQFAAACASDHSRPLKDQVIESEQLQTLLIKFPTGILKTREITQPERNLEERPTCIYIHGDSNSGKTYFVKQITKEFRERLGWDVFSWSCQMTRDGIPWFDGYDGQRVVVMNEFRSSMSFASFLSVVDTGPCMVQVKGGRTQLLAEIFIITSRIPLEGQYPNVTAQCADNRDQLTNRISTVVHLDGSKGKGRSAACIAKVQGAWDLLFPPAETADTDNDEEDEMPASLNSEDIDFLDDLSVLDSDDEPVDVPGPPPLKRIRPTPVSVPTVGNLNGAPTAPMV